MRTSGATQESRLTLAVWVIALGVIILVAGGPGNLMNACENTLRSVAEAIYRGWLAFRA